MLKCKKLFSNISRMLVLPFFAEQARCAVFTCGAYVGLRMNRQKRWKMHDKKEISFNLKKKLSRNINKQISKEMKEASNNLLEQALARVLQQIQHRLKPCFSSVVGVRNSAVCDLG